MCEGVGDQRISPENEKNPDQGCDECDDDPRFERAGHESVLEKFSDHGRG